MRARYIKIILWICALFAVWQLGRSDVATNALFLFAAVGVVPGTDIVLTPEQVFLVLGCLLGVAIVLIFGTNLRRMFVLLFGRQSDIVDAPTGEIAQAVAEEPQPMPEVSAIPVKSARTKTPPSKSIFVLKLKPPRAPGKLVLFVRVLAGALRLRLAQSAATARQRFPHAIAALARMLARVRQTAWILQQYMARAAHRTGRILRRQCIKVAIIVGRMLVRLWAWLEPRVRLIDYWLGVQFRIVKDALNRNEKVRIARSFSREAIRVFAGARTGIRAALTRVVEK